MADTKISALTAASAAAGANEIAINEAGTTKKLTVTQLAAFIPSEDQVNIATASLSAANIIAMYATPIEVIAAPGAGKVIVVDQAVWSFTYGGTQFTGGGTCRLIEETSEAHLIGGPTAAEMQAAADIIKFVRPSDVGFTIVVNKAVLVKNITGAYATGNGTMKVFIRYRVITL